MDQYPYSPHPGQGTPAAAPVQAPGAGGVPANYMPPQPVPPAAWQPVYQQPVVQQPVYQQQVVQQPVYAPPAPHIPAQPGYMPNGYGMYYAPTGYPAPPFVVGGSKRDPKVTSASKSVNRLCLVVLMQTLAAFVFEMPLVFLATVQGVNVLGDDLANQLLLTAMVPLSTALPFFIYLKIGRKDVTEYLRFEKVGFFTALLCVLAGLGVCLLGNFPAFFIQDLFGNFGYEPVPQVGGGEDSWLLFALEFLCTAVLVPVMEEFAFRGVLFSSLRKHGTGFAIIASALVFSFVHLDFSNVVFAFIAGLVFGFLYARTGNLWVTIFIHALNNGIAVVGSYGSFLFQEDLAGIIDSALMYGPILLGLIALIILLTWKRKWLFSPVNPQASHGLKGGRAMAAIARAPLFWVITAMMTVYTVTLFF